SGNHPQGTGRRTQAASPSHRPPLRRAPRVRAVQQALPRTEVGGPAGLRRRPHRGPVSSRYGP
ncbi:hypothetical protein AB4Z54_48095, partial [Streptomyces sp. MCAF7]